MTFYVPRHFRHDDEQALERFVAAHAFGTLVTTGSAGLSVSHVPFLPERGSDGKLRLFGHLARANAHWQELEAAADVLAIFAGPHAYVSPGWYEVHPSVPTWNYAVVHARGKARLLPEAALEDLLDRLSRIYEDGRPLPWRIDRLPPEHKARLFTAIVPFEIAVERLEGKFKLSQNRSRADVDGVIAGLRAQGEDALANLIQATAGSAPDSR